MKRQKKSFPLIIITSPTIITQKPPILITQIATNLQMNQYLTHIFEQFTLKSSSKQFNTLIKQQLLQLKPIDLTKLYKHLTPSTSLFNQLNLLLAKGVLKYSPANCTVELSLPNVMVYQRMFRMAYFAQEELEAGVGEFVNDWIEQGLENGMGFPVIFQKKKLEKALSFNPLEQVVIMNTQTQEAKKKSKSKNKLQPQTKQKPQKQQQPSHLYNYHKLIYEYKSHQQPKIPSKNQQQTQKTPQPHTKKPSSKPARKISKQLAQQSHQQQTYQSYMLNVQQLTKLLQWSICLKLANSQLGQKQKKLKLFEFVNSKDREQIMQVFCYAFRQQLKYQKLEQFISQVLSPDCLLVFNLIKKYPLITQKQLAKLTMLQVLSTRTSLNQLIEKGLIYFYNENARTIVYKVVDLQILEKKYVDIVARGMVNLALAGERIGELAGVSIGQDKVKAKLIQFECQMQRLDDVLVMFGW